MYYHYLLLSFGQLAIIYLHFLPEPRHGPHLGDPAVVVG